MAYYRECPTCGAHLDPGERCMECAEKEKERNAGVELEWHKMERVRPLRATGTFRRVFPPSEYI